LRHVSSTSVNGRPLHGAELSPTSCLTGGAVASWSLSTKGDDMAATPKWDLDSALNRGRAAHRLLEDNSEVLTPELEEGLGAQLEADIAFLSVESDGGALGTQRTATATEREIAEDAQDL